MGVDESPNGYVQYTIFTASRAGDVVPAGETGVEDAVETHAVLGWVGAASWGEAVEEVSLALHRAYVGSGQSIS